jgi:hypothetical protein
VRSEGKTGAGSLGRARARPGSNADRTPPEPQNRAWRGVVRDDATAAPPSSPCTPSLQPECAPASSSSDTCGGTETTGHEETAPAGARDAAVTLATAAGQLGFTACSTTESVLDLGGTRGRPQSDVQADREAGRIHRLNWCDHL